MKIFTLILIILAAGIFSYNYKSYTLYSEITNNQTITRSKLAREAGLKHVSAKFPISFGSVLAKRALDNP